MRCPVDETIIGTFPLADRRSPLLGRGRRNRCPRVLQVRNDGHPVIPHLGHASFLRGRSFTLASSAREDPFPPWSWSRPATPASLLSTTVFQYSTMELKCYLDNALRVRLPEYSPARVRRRSMVATGLAPRGCYGGHIRGAHFCRTVSRQCDMRTQFSPLPPSRASFPVTKG